ncbi:ABC transporter ATP-binding protein [Dactylosporangium sp. NPDC051485]|uniref:ABC transporter ATP-binding protein n=1 Tax=Dactylosporangium sp. NPDC051485 TaxID=3154846 RepID=UPI0034304B51
MSTATAANAGGHADPVALEVSGLTVRFGGLVALSEASVTAYENEITALIGPNGAGKTTLFNCLTGVYQADAGSIEYRGQQLRGLRPDRIANHGISRTFQNLALFPQLTARENVIVGLHRTRQTGWVSNALRLPQVLREETAVREQADAAMAELGLSAVADLRISELPYGTLKRIEIARALVSGASLLLLDEPAGGLSHEEVDEFMELIRRVRSSRSLTILLVEHHMGLVMKLCDRVTVLNFGRTIAAGTPAEVSEIPAVIAAYLGGGE